MDIKGSIQFIEGGFILKPYGKEQETWYRSASVGDNYIVLDGFKYRPSSFKVKEVSYSDDDQDDDLYS
jgi:hypothetical protein